VAARDDREVVPPAQGLFHRDPEAPEQQIDLDEVDLAIVEILPLFEILLPAYTGFVHRRKQLDDCDQLHIG